MMNTALTRIRYDKNLSRTIPSLVALSVELLNYLDKLNNRGIRFALSNVLQSKGKENKILLDWVNRNIGRYRVIYPDYTYANSNYHTKDRTSKTDEVLIVNY